MNNTLAVNRSKIARATGTNLAHISRIFSGKSNPSLELAKEIARHMNITVDELCAELNRIKKTKEVEDSGP